MALVAHLMSNKTMSRDLYQKWMNANIISLAEVSYQKLILHVIESLQMIELGFTEVYMWVKYMCTTPDWC